MLILFHLLANGNHVSQCQSVALPSTQEKARVSQCQSVALPSTQGKARVSPCQSAALPFTQEKARVSPRQSVALPFNQEKTVSVSVSPWFCHSFFILTDEKKLLGSQCPADVVPHAEHRTGNGGKGNATD